MIAQSNVPEQVDEMKGLYSKISFCARGPLAGAAARRRRSGSLIRWLMVLLVGLALAGCGKKESASGSAPGSARSLGKATPRQYVVKGQIDLQALTATLREYVIWKNKIPADLNELVASGFLASLPEPPPGKRFGINRGPMKYEVVLIDQ
jgi:hypothetical protein